MKILEIIPKLQAGGAESFVIYFSNEIQSQGHECQILTLYNQQKEDINTYGLSEKIKCDSLEKKIGFDIRCLWYVYKHIKNVKPDIVHVHVTAIPYILISAILYRKCKYFATIHSEAKREANKGFHKIIRKLMFKIHLVKAVTISEESRKSFVDFYNVEPEMIYNGVPPYNKIIEKKEYRDKLVFVHPARSHPIKNQELLFSAFSELTKKYSNIELQWYGDYNEYPMIYQKLKPYFCNQIKYMGYSKNIRDILVNSDAMCLSSIMEGMPMTIIEAMSVKCVPITTPVGGCINMIDNGKNGFLSKDLTVESYIEALESFIILTDSDRDRIRNQAYDSYNQLFSISKSVGSYLSIFSK